MPEGDQKLMDEVRVLEERLREIRTKIESAGEPVPQDKELLRTVVRERMEEAGKPAPSPIPPVPPPPPVTPALPTQHSSHTHQVGSPHDKAGEVKEFVDIAFEKDIPTAVHVVRKTGNAHVLDEFHDVLVDKFYEELVKRGKLKQF